MEDDVIISLPCDGKMALRRVQAVLFAPNAPEKLKTIGAENGYLRLPIETEWESAARGSLSVSDAERANNRFFSTGSIDDYAWWCWRFCCRRWIIP